jgi:hypothetical protein
VDTGVCQASISATFTNVSICGGCIVPPFNDCAHSLTVADINVNTDFLAMPEDAFTPSCNYYSPGDQDVVAIDRDPYNTDCSTPVGPTNRTDALSIFFYPSDGNWRVAYQVSCGISGFLFYAVVSGTLGGPPASVNNGIINCASAPWAFDPNFTTIFGFAPANCYAIGFGGSVDITCP